MPNFDIEVCNKQVLVDFITEDEAICARASSSCVSFSGFLAVIEVHFPSFSGCVPIELLSPLWVYLLYDVTDHMMSIYLHICQYTCMEMIYKM